MVHIWQSVRGIRRLRYAQPAALQSAARAPEGKTQHRLRSQQRSKPTGQERGKALPGKYQCKSIGAHN